MVFDIGMGSVFCSLYPEGPGSNRLPGGSANRYFTGLPHLPQMNPAFDFASLSGSVTSKP